MLGPLLALLSAATFGMTSAALRRGVLGGTILQGLSITVPLGVPLFAIACVVAGAVDTFFNLSQETWIWMVAAGLIHFIVGRYGNYRATRALGATQSAPVQHISVLVSLALALIFLDEYLTPLRALGIALVIAGPMFVLRRRVKKGEVRTRSGVKLNYLEGYFWGSVCAVAWGVSPLLIRFGLAGGGVTESLAGGLVSYLAATTVIALVVMVPGNITHVRAINLRTASWFLTSGSLVFFSQMFRYMALSVAPVSVVVPIQQTQVIFRLIFGWLINRNDEVFGTSVLLGIALSSIGVLALTISVDFVLELVPLPEAIVDLARMRWP